MKRVIDQKLYDTEAATEIARYEPHADTGDFSYIRESLYRTENGRYFLTGVGGPQTKYADELGNGTRATGEQLKPFTVEDALDWCEERNIDGEIVMEEFEDEIEPA